MNQESASTRQPRLVAALAGGWVADAASLGLHWLYDSERVREVGGDAPEFMEPREEHYKGVFGYFAHGGKRSGDISHYGAATGVLTDSLLASRDILDVRDYQRRFRTFFGPGGQWHGYIDNPTRITLDNLNRNEQAAIEKALATTTVNLTDRQKRILVQKVLPYTRYLSGEALAEPVRTAINLTYQDPAIQDAGVHIAQTIDRQLTRLSGADDTQLPAITKLPPLVACYCGDDDLMAATEAAARVTNHSDEAVVWARCSARLLDHLFRDEPMLSAIEAAIAEAPDPEALSLAQAVSSLDGPRAGDSHGRTCYLHEAMPVIFHILAHAKSFTEAVRANILCGGDSCGRAWIIGPAMAAVYGIGGAQGIPLSWLARLNDGDRILSDLEKLVATERSLQNGGDD